MMIIHSPQPWLEVNQSEDRYFEGNLEAWGALTDAYKAGKIRAIGVSNFLQEDIDNLMNHAEIKPMVNQVLCHIANTPLIPLDDILDRIKPVVQFGGRIKHSFRTNRVVL